MAVVRAAAHFPFFCPVLAAIYVDSESPSFHGFSMCTPDELLIRSPLGKGGGSYASGGVGGGGGGGGGGGYRGVAAPLTMAGAVELATVVATVATAGTTAGTTTPGICQHQAQALRA